MKNYNVTLILIILFFSFLTNVNAQVAIHGKAVDNESGEGIPFASVQIGNSTHGTACNQYGEFVLKIDQEFYNDSLKISCIGYSNAVISIQTLVDNLKEEYIFKIDPFIGFLDEVIVNEKRETPEELMKKAINAIPQNYIQQPFNMEFYSRLSVQDNDQEIIYQLESIMLTYKKGYVPASYSISKALYMRETGKKPLPFNDYVKDDKEYFPYWSGFTITGIDQIGLGYSVFNPKNYNKMIFEYGDISIFDQDTVIAIEYSNKKNRMGGGKVYIALNSLAFIKHSYSVGKQTFEIIYKRVGEYYFPYLLKGKMPTLHDENLFIVDESSLTNINTDDVILLEQEHDHWFPTGVPNDEEYWNTNYPIKK